MMTPYRHTFRKAERLCGKKKIEALFFGRKSENSNYAGGGHSLSAYPLRVVYMVTKNNAKPVQILISVSKRRFKHAVDRNRTKRLIREAYRLNKKLLLEQLQEEQQLHIAFLWISDELSDFPTVEARMKNLLQRIGENVRNNE